MDQSSRPLTEAQASALAWVGQRAAADVPGAERQAAALLGRAGESEGALDALLDRVHRSGRVTLNFHPDRLLDDGRSTIEALSDEGVYRNQFETRISNGGLSAHPGGDRDEWERELFGGAYQRPGVHPPERPKYGALNLLGHPEGASPRFGSCYLRLRPEVMERCTFTFGDSHLQPVHRATSSTFTVIVAALLGAANETHGALGVPTADAVSALRLIESRCTPSPRPPERADAARSLDDYIEVQLHGPVRLVEDVEALVVDPSFRGTANGGLIAKLGLRFEIPVLFHRGFELDVGEVCGEFRGPKVPLLAQAIGERFGCARVNAELIGRAAASVVRQPERWDAWGSRAETLQLLKMLWHVLVRFGDPVSGHHPSA